ncbi:MAG TPA: DNA repair protein RadA [Verrucomicrobiae bacterium]|nr:DNA repair protein RadA [Verrucomicrobiae bacterium]
MKAPAQVFECSKCGAQSSKWAGRCAECGTWGSISQEAVSAKGISPGRSSQAKSGSPEPFLDLNLGTARQRETTGLAVIDRLLSGGLVPGSVTLLGGEPGIGKSTLLAQLALTLAQAGKQVMYVTGEESPAQVSIRLKRLVNVGAQHAVPLPGSLLFLDETDAATVAATIAKESPDLTIVDSIQTMRTADLQGEPGNPNQVKASAATITEVAKRSHASVILVGQVTKDGDLAGPRLLEHLVDTVMMMTGDRTQAFRLLFVTKHRFGSTDETALLSMKEGGLEEVLDPSAALLADRPLGSSGTIVSCLVEGSRAMLVELQALVTSAGYGTPLRRVSGVDLNRTALLLAVLGRRAGVGFGDQDAFVNTVGGIEAKDTSVDLGVCLALASAKLDVVIPPSFVAWGEVGLAGELRAVGRTDARLKEARRMGFDTAIVPFQKDAPAAPAGLRVIPCKTLREALQVLTQGAK